MPMVKCPACKKVMTSNALACPSCGEPIKSSIEKASEGINPDDPVHIFGLIIFGIMIPGIIFLVVKSCTG